MIHSTAIIGSKVKLGEGVEVGPYAILDGEITVGPKTKIGPHAVISGWTEIGSENQVGVGAVIGLEPQDLSYKGEKTRVKIGDRNNIREYAQIHRGTGEGGITTVGNDNLILGFSHIAHDCHIGNNIILANGALLAGHAIVEDFAYISGLCLVHQFVRLGKYSMMRGGARVSLNIPPYCMADDANSLRGLNTVGLERRGFSPADIKEIKSVYRQIFGGEKPMNEQVESLLGGNLSAPAKYFVQFIKESERGVCRPQKS